MRISRKQLDPGVWVSNLRTGACLACALVWLGCGCDSAGDGTCESDAAKASTPPHIVLVLIDTLRRDHLSPYGSSLATPSIQALADRGQVFRDLTAGFHQTTMSMAALFTGRTPSTESGDPREPLPWSGRNWCGMARFADPEGDSCIPRMLPTLAEVLDDAGYTTAGVVSNRLLFQPAGYDQGFRYWVEVGPGDEDERPLEEHARYRTAAQVHRALEELLPSLEGPEPVFLYVHYLDVHDWTVLDIPYARAVEQMDRDIGALFGLLATTHWFEDAVVVLTSDHGEILDEEHPLTVTATHFGNPTWESLLRVPLIIAPAVAADPDRPLRGQDLGGLIREIARLPPAPVEDLEPDEVFLSEQKYVTYRRGRWKSIFHRTNLGQWGLFDLESDPDEKVNVAKQERDRMATHLARVQEISKRLGTHVNRDAALTDEDLERLRALGYAE